MNRHWAALFAAGLTLATLSVDWWTWSRLRSARERARDAAVEVVRCRQLADDILRLHDHPTIAGSHEIELTELSRRIERAAADSGIPTGNVVRISPDAARHPDVPAMSEAGHGVPSASEPGGIENWYLEKPTTVLLSDVTLQQLVGFLYSVGTGPAGMDVRSLRLTAPRDRDVGDRWEAEVTVSYLIYAPPLPQGGTASDATPSQFPGR